MNIAGDLLIVEERLARERQQGVGGVLPTPDAIGIETPPTEVIAAKRLHIDGRRYEAGERLTLAGLQLRELLTMGKVWIPKGWDFWGARGRILATEPCDVQPFASQP